MLLQSNEMAPVQRNPMAVTWERSFFAALRALTHVYFQLEQAGLELHSNCELCNEIRNFSAQPNYRADNIQSDTDWKQSFIIARDALKHLHTKLNGDGMQIHSATCLGCVEIREFLCNPSIAASWTSHCKSICTDR